MSVLDSFFNKGFKASKCKTLLKFTIPRIKLLRNRREIQIKQMRRDIAKLLETGQEATSRDWSRSYCLVAFSGPINIVDQAFPIHDKYKII